MNSELEQKGIIEAEITPLQKVGGGTKDHSELENLDYEHSGHTGFQPAGDYVEDSNYVHTDNNYTVEEKTKLSNLENYDDTEIKRDIQSLEDTKVDKEVNKGLSTNDYTNEEKSKLASLENYDDTDVKSDINDIKLSYSLKTETGSVIEVDINSSTYVMTINLKNSVGTVLSTDNIDLPLETMVVGASYDSVEKEIVLTLKNGNTLRFSVADLVSGLQTEITSTNKLDSSLVDDSLSDNKFVTPAEKATWNNKSDFSGDYTDLTNKPSIPSTISDLSDDSTHRTVTDTEKTNWDSKLESADLKTVNGNSLVGSGDIEISGGESSISEMFYDVRFTIITETMTFDKSFLLKVINNYLKNNTYNGKCIFAISNPYNNNTPYLTGVLEFCNILVTTDATNNSQRIILYFTGSASTLATFTSSYGINYSYNLKILQVGNLIVDLDEYNDGNVTTIYKNSNKTTEYGDSDTYSIRQYTGYSFPTNIGNYPISWNNTSSFTPTSNYNLVHKKYVDDKPTTYAGYDATKTQVLKNVNGVLTWVDE